MQRLHDKQHPLLQDCDGMALFAVSQSWQWGAMNGPVGTVCRSGLDGLERLGRTNAHVRTRQYSRPSVRFSDAAANLIEPPQIGPWAHGPATRLLRQGFDYSAGCENTARAYQRRFVKVICAAPRRAPAVYVRSKVFFLLSFRGGRVSIS